MQYCLINIDCIKFSIVVSNVHMYTRPLRNNARISLYSCCHELTTTINNVRVDQSQGSQRIDTAVYIKYGEIFRKKVMF